MPKTTTTKCSYCGKRRKVQEVTINNKSKIDIYICTPCNDKVGKV
jgi:protein-arginine kinase activator protein McsA